MTSAQCWEVMGGRTCGSGTGRPVVVGWVTRFVAEQSGSVQRGAECLYRDSNGVSSSAGARSGEFL